MGGPGSGRKPGVKNQRKNIEKKKSTTSIYTPEQIKGQKEYEAKIKRDAKHLEKIMAKEAERKKKAAEWEAINKVSRDMIASRNSKR